MNHPGSVDVLRPASQSLRTEKKSFKVVFLSANARDAQERLQAIMMTHPLDEIKFFHLDSSNPLDQVTSKLKSFEEDSVDTVWFLVGDHDPLISELATFDDEVSLGCWKKTLINQAQFSFFDPIDGGVAERLAKLTAATVKNGYDRNPLPLFDEIIFIDEGSRNHQGLVNEILKTRDAEIVLLESNRCGIQQIRQYLQNRQGITSIHVICPGSPGNLHLATSLINAQTIEDHHRLDLEAIGQSLCGEAEIRIYDDRFNQGPEGLATLKSLSSYSGAFVVVSKNQNISAETEKKEFFANESPNVEPLNILLPQANLLPTSERSAISRPSSVNTAVIAEDLSETDQRRPRFTHPAPSLIQRTPDFWKSFDFQLTLGILLVGLAIGFMAALTLIQLGVL